MVYTKDDYAIAYTEIIEILKNLPENDLRKIPKEIIQDYILNMDKEYKFTYNTSLEFEEQNISHLSKIIIANLYIDYLADEEEREKIKENDKKELYELELEKQKKYPTDKLFENKKRLEHEQHTNQEQVTQLVVIKEKNVLQKILEKVKRLFKRN